jgi:transposase InsO family protein
MCAWLGVSRSGFYEWRDRPASATAQRREDLKALVAEIFDDSDETYGYRRVARRRARGTIGGLAVLQRESLTAVRVGPTGNRTSRREEQRTLPNRRDRPCGSPWAARMLKGVGPGATQASTHLREVTTWPD